MNKTKHGDWFSNILLPGIAMLAASVVVASDAPLADGYAVADSSGQVEVSNAGAAVTVKFVPARPPATTVTRCDLLVGGSDPASVFKGDISADGYSGMRFKITGTGVQPGSASIAIRIIESLDPLKYHDWYYSGVTVSSQPGEWVITDVPLQREKGWTTARAYRLTDAQMNALWAADLQRVSAMYVRLQAGGYSAQAYSLSDFRLMGPGIISEPANLSGLQHYFGVDSLEGLSDAELKALMSQDYDGDGMSDYQEILAGFDPGSAASVFASRMQMGTGSNTITWDGVLGKTYAVWRSNDLAAGFMPLVEGRACEVTGVMSFDDVNPAVDAPNFYKVVSY